MSGAAVGALLVCVAVWVAWPDPRHQLRRLSPPGPAAAVPWMGSLRARAGALPLGKRVLLGLCAAAAIVAWRPSAEGAAWGALAALGVVVIGGRIVRVDRAQEVAWSELADTVELLAVCLEAGQPMEHALTVVGEVSEPPTASILSRVKGQMGLGVPEQQAWGELVDDTVWGAVARDLARSARSGTSLVGVLHVHADEARLAMTEHALQRARTAGVRSVVPLMACFLPAFVLVGVLPIIAGLLGALLSS